MSAAALQSDFGNIAVQAMKRELRVVREAFRPSDAIEALVLLAFTRGACWALDVDLEATVADPTPWCYGCGARRQQDCHCGPIADNE